MGVFNSREKKIFEQGDFKSMRLNLARYEGNEIFDVNFVL